MAKVRFEKLPTDDQRAFLELAVVEHYRNWLCFDGIERARVDADGGSFNATRLRRIASYYRVSRGIRRSKEHRKAKTDPNAVWLAQRVEGDSQNWPESLGDRADLCKQIAVDADADQCDGKSRTNGCQASAVTKFMWFLHPDGWTVFDNFAARGLSVDQRKSATDRMVDFYDRLDKRGFSAAAGAINEDLKSSAFAALYGERVIDLFLMFAGANEDWTRNIAAMRPHFLGQLPKPISSELVTVAKKIASRHAENLLRPVHQ